MTLMTNEQTSDTNYLQLFQHTPLPTYIWKMSQEKMVLENFNKAAIDFSGPILNQFISKTADEIFADVPKIMEALHQCCRLKVPVTIEMEMPKRTTGELRFLKCSWIWVSDETLIYHVQDLTDMRNIATRLDQKVAERTAELKATNEQLLLAVDEIQEKKLFLKHVFDSIQEGICVLDPDMNVLKVNKTMEKLYDLEPTIVGDKCYNVFQNDRQKVCDFCPALKSIKEKIPNKAIVHAIHGKTQTDIWTEVFTFPILDASDKVTGIIEFVRDITDRKRLEDQLKSNEQKYRNLLDNQDDAIFLHKLHAEGFSFFEEVNQRAVDHYGYSIEEFQQLSPENITLAEDVKKHGTSMERRKLLEQGRLVFETTHIKKNGEQFPVEISATIVENDGEDYILSVARDISERKKIERKAKDNEQFLANVFNSIQDGVTVLDLNLNIMRVNPQIELQFANHMPLIGKKCYEVFGQQDSICPFCPSIEAMKSGKITRHEIPSPNSDNPTSWIELTAFPFLDEHGKTTGVLEYTKDITPRKQAEAEQSELESQLRQKNKMEAVGYMAGGMAHNFNNNLGIILGNIELSKIKSQSNSEVGSYLDNAKTAVLRSRDLVKQIITYSRKGIQNKASMTLLAVVDETITLLSSTLPSTINLKKSVGPKCHSTFIHADASQIQEILVNLCNNAARAMNEKGDLTISLGPVDLGQTDIPIQYDGLPGRYAGMSVQDTGCGMPAEMLDKIFDPFYTTKEDYEGAGMGLATVQGIVAQHGGLIKVDSVLGQGSVFNLYFPLTDEIATEPETENSSLSRGTERILFVDDDEMLASLGEQLLTQYGYQVTTMFESREALKLFAANADRFNMVITDQTMPDLTGEELIQEVKKISPDMPTILCTGYSSKIDEDKAKELGINAFLMKPLDLPKLLQTVRQVLDEDKE